MAGAAGGEPGAIVGVTVGAADEANMAAPHLLQNLVPGTRPAPQELQNAMGYLIGKLGCRQSARVYRRLEGNAVEGRQRQGGGATF